MAQRELKGALRDTLREEKTTASDRFARAEGYFADKESASPPPVEKVIRDGFTMPPADYALIAQIQERSLEGGLAVAKSEVLRAGLHVLHRMPMSELKEVFLALEKIKTGRPAKQ